MKNKWIVLVGLIMALAWPFAACGQSSPGPANSSSTAVPSITSSVVHSSPEVENSEKLRDAKQQIALLKQQIELQRSYQSDILATVYWALGGVVGLAALLVGFGWFANFKFYERDKASLKAELFAASSEHLLLLEEKLGGQVDALSEAVEQRVSVKVKRISARVFDIEFNQKAVRMRRTKDPDMALTAALRLLELSERGRPDEIPNIIKFMLDKLQLGGKFTADEIIEVSIVVDRLPKQYKTLADKLSAKLMESGIFDL